MQISGDHIENRNDLMTGLRKLASLRLDASEAEHVLSFAELYLPSFPLEEWQGRELSDLLGFLRELTILLADQQSPTIKIYNPSIEENGWLCNRTVILVVQKDMPFLVDSIRMALTRHEDAIQVIHSNTLSITRTPESRADIQAAKSPEGGGTEAIICFEISLCTDEGRLNTIRSAIIKTLEDVACVVDDYLPMQDRLKVCISNYEAPEHKEYVEFLHWLKQSHFTFMGCREFELTQDNDERVLKELPEQRLGMFRHLELTDTYLPYKQLSQGVRDFHDSDALLCFSKFPARSTVHREVYPDYIVAKKLDSDGKIIGEVRFLGVFTHSVSMISPVQIPLLRHKVTALMARSGFNPNGYNGRNLMRVMEDLPKEELFQADDDSLYKNICAIAAINERHIVRLIARVDPFVSFVNCMVFVPRDWYSTHIRLQIQQLIGTALDSDELDSTSHFSESLLARAQFVFRVDRNKPVQLNIEALEADILNLTRNWEANFRSALLDSLGEAKGISHFNQYRHAFSSGYQEHYDARSAVADIAMLEGFGDGRDIVMNLYRPVDAKVKCMRFKVMHRDSPLALSDAIPVLENLGFRVLGEQPYKIVKKNGEVIWLHDFDLKFSLSVTVDVHVARKQFEEAFAAVWYKQCESDAFNRLVLAARLNWREVVLLRAYAGYLKQVTFNATQEFIANTLVHHTEITRSLLALFKASFDPRLNRDKKPDSTVEQERIARLRKSVVERLDSVSNLNEDKVFRRYLDLINATLRTNYFQKENTPDGNGNSNATGKGDVKSYIAIKFSPRDIPGIPEPRPMFEIYIYSTRIEGVHLRGGKVARGGLRWSDRVQDYRTEVLGLVKAQQVKNAVIVPDGAKGGFVAKQLDLDASRDAFMAEGIACYKIFIQGLLDITDNLVHGEVVKPENVRCRDGDDPYLVVAADKGTATFSDIANEISMQNKHWLGDAFASGGSHGYDHKGMGITARGAWISVQRHFRERGLDIQTEPFSIIGIGDMAGDVFGNGLLLSEHSALLAAFNHMHIFIDPTPDAAKSFVERSRLFALERSTWDDYDRSLMSKGGGIFLRSAKSIKLTDEMRQAFDIDAKSLAPTELITALLKAPVDLIWNGGIGTYVKASWESHSQVGDKANDVLRVDGKELHCKVFGEGGNLGMTQLGRVEFALHGGACNTDFIDNAAGVDCSDHEVNIKILLDELIANGDLTGKQRNQILVSMTDDVSRLVLQNNYRQTFAISLAENDISRRINEYRRFISFMVEEGHLNRDLEFLPSDDEILDRTNKGKCLTRPELSVLISYAKVMLKQALINSDITDDAYMMAEIETAFPSLLLERYRDQVYSHRLRREIVGTQVANDLVNNLGITACHRILETTGAPLADIAKAYIVSRDVFKLSEFQDYIGSLDNRVPAEIQMRLMSNMMRRVRRGTRWFLRNRRAGLEPAKDVAV
ncbi:MAG: NAD-glutamate dehydrogenase, partial [Alteromonadaceae bacterium]